MAKVPVRLFQLPLISVVGQPWLPSPDDKNYWVSFDWEGGEFVLDQLAVLDTGRSFHVRDQMHAGEKHKLQFKGIPEKALTSGLKLYDGTWPVRHERKAYLVPLGAQNQTLNAVKGTLKSRLLPEAGVEVDLHKLDAGGDKFLLAVTARRLLPCLVGQVFTVEPATGAAFDAALVTCGTLEPRDLSDFVIKTFRFPGLPTVNALYSINLRVAGWVVLPPALADEEFEESEGAGPVRIMTKALAHFAKKARNAAAQPGGISREALKEKMALPDAVFSFLMLHLADKGEVKIVDGFYLPTADPMTYLSPIAKKALQQLEDAGANGLDVENEPNSLFKRTYGELARMGLAVQTETPWLYSLGGFSQLAAKLCPAGSLGQTWKIADVKELLGVTRKPILGILNKLEEQGWLERKEDHRVVIKVVEAL
jgi:hypothetical protein